MVNSIAEKLKLPGVKNLVEAEPGSGFRGAAYDWDTGIMTVDSRLKGNARVSVILHELGHHVVGQALGEQLGLTPNQVVTLDQDGLLAAMDKKDLAMSLKGANDQLKEFFFNNMSGRSAKLMRDDMEAMGPVRLKDVDEAQGKMVSTAKDLAARGEIIIMKTKADDQMVA